MSGYYPPNHQIPLQYYNADPNELPSSDYPHAPPTMAPHGGIPHLASDNAMYHAIPGPFGQYAEAALQQSYREPYEDVSAHAMDGRTRRRSGTADQVKHRRTRSGCFTCRQRRVKCDETHPICDRCRKGNRDCVYPEPQTKSKPSRSGRSSQGAGPDASSPDDRGDEESQARLPAIPDGDGEDYDMASNAVMTEDALQDASDTPALTLDRSPSLSEASSSVAHVAARPSLSRKPSSQTTNSPVLISRQGFSKDVSFYLNYFKNHMTVHHYALKRDGGNFLKKEFLELAMKHQPLRYAVVGYAAYFHTLSQPNGRIQTFLQYYNESVSRLRALITRSKKQGLSTFLTILQLANIEEVLGDWVNLMGHQKAAYEILTRLYTPETITQTEVLRKVLLWYVRFDLFVGFQSRGESVLGREWYVAIHDYYAAEARRYPDSLDLKYEARFAYSRLVAKDSNDLFARKARGLITEEEFRVQLPKLAEIIRGLDKNIDPALLDPCDYVTDLTGEPGPESIVNPYEPNIIWGGARLTSNYLVMDMYAIDFMFQIQASLVLGRQFDADLPEKAHRVVQMFEAVRLYPKGPPGAIIEAQACLAIATLFLPKDAKTIEWCRRTFAKIEASGYIYSNILRQRMLDQWGLEPSDWWLPHDQGCPAVIRSIKDFIAERTTAPRDQTSEDLREMKGIFATLTISESPADDSVGSTPPGGEGRVPSNAHESLTYMGGSPGLEWNGEGPQPDGDGCPAGQLMER